MNNSTHTALYFLLPQYIGATVAENLLAAYGIMLTLADITAIALDGVAYEFPFRVSVRFTPPVLLLKLVIFIGSPIKPVWLNMPVWLGHKINQAILNLKILI